MNWFSLATIPLLSIGLLIRSYEDYLLEPKHELSLKEIRKEKLNKLRRKKWL